MIKPPLRAKTDAELMISAIYEGIWRGAVAAGITPRNWLKALDLVDTYNGDIYWPGRIRNDLPEILILEDSFSKWMRRYLKIVPNTEQDISSAPLKQLTNSAALDRIRLIDLFLQISRRQSAEHTTSNAHLSSGMDIHRS